MPFEAAQLAIFAWARWERGAGCILIICCCNGSGILLPANMKSHGAGKERQGSNDD